MEKLFLVTNINETIAAINKMEFLQQKIVIRSKYNLDYRLTLKVESLRKLKR